MQHGYKIKQNRFDKEIAQTTQFQFQLAEGEKLKQIDGFGGRYYISNYGKIYSTWFNKALKPFYHREYQYVKLCYEYKTLDIGVNQLTALYWCKNDNPQEKTIVHHIDGNSINNKANNLQWVSFPEHLALHNCKQRIKLE